MLNKLHMTLITYDKGIFYEKKKVNEIIFILWLDIYILSLVIKMQFFGEQREQVMFCHVPQLLIISNLFIIILK
jgi:hypothetical protein